jgi:predicted dehydrogenase
MHRIGIAGFGFMGQFHFRAYREIPGAQVTALYDVDEKVFDRAPTQGNLGVADLAGVKDVAKFSDFDRFLAQDIDVVDVCAPTDFHRELSMRALASGRAVLVEKPMALSVADCDAMIGAARRAKKLLMVGQCVRFWPGYDRILDAARKGTYGRPLSATLRRIGGAPTWSGWFLDSSRSGGGVLDCLVHDFDFARAAFGIPLDVDARGTLDVLGAGSGVSYCRAGLRYANGPSSVTIEGGWVIGAAFPFNMSAFFQCEDATMVFSMEPGAPLAIYRRDGTKEVPVITADQGYVFELRYFLECLEEKKPPERCPPEESRDAIALALAARESVRRGTATAVTALPD